MARLFTCGFEENNLLETMWIAKTGTVSIVTTPVHGGTYALSINPTTTVSNLERDFASAIGEGNTSFTRFYFRAGALPASEVNFFAVKNLGGGESFSLKLNSSGIIRLKNNPTGSSFNSTFALAADTWYRFEVRHLASDTVGQIEVRLYTGDSTTAEEIWGDGDFPGGDGSDNDTVASAAQRWAFGDGGANTFDFFWDDIVVNDNSGAAPFNTWPGPGKIALQKTASDSAVAFERSAGSVNSDNVDDLPGAPDDGTTYNFEAVTLNSVDRLNAGALPAEIPSSAQIKAVDVYARVGSDQPSPAALRLKLWDEGGSLTNGPAVATGLNGWRILDTEEHLVFDPAGKTKANVESFDYGYENITDVATRERRVTALWANIEWLEVIDNAAQNRRRSALTPLPFLVLPPVPDGVID